VKRSRGPPTGTSTQSAETLAAKVAGPDLPTNQRLAKIAREYSTSPKSRADGVPVSVRFRGCCRVHRCSSGRCFCAGGSRGWTGERRVLCWTVCEAAGCSGTAVVCGGGAGVGHVGYLAFWD